MPCRCHPSSTAAASSASGTAAVGLAAGAPFAVADEKDDPFGGFTLGVQSYTYRKFPIEQTLKRVQDLGLHHLEISRSGHFSKGITPEQAAAVLKLCKEYEITPLAFGVQGFTKDHDANKQIFEVGKVLGIRMFSADPDPDSFDSLDKLCDEYKIAIGIHPHGPQKGKLHRWYSAEVILPAVKDHNALIGTCLDTGHLIRAAQLGKKLDPAEEIRKMGAAQLRRPPQGQRQRKGRQRGLRQGRAGRAGRAEGAARGQVPGDDQHRVRGQRGRADRGRAGLHPGFQGLRQEAVVNGAGGSGLGERVGAGGSGH